MRCTSILTINGLDFGVFLAHARVKLPQTGMVITGNISTFEAIDFELLKSI